MILTTALVYFCLFSAFTTCALGFYVHASGHRSPVSRLFFFCMLGATYWALGEYFIWTAGTAGEALFWLKASALWPVVIVVTVHFVLAFTEHPLVQPGRSPYLLVLLYLLGGLFSLVGMFTGLTHSIVPVEGGRYGYIAIAAGPAYLAECVFILIIIAGGIAASLSAWRTAVSPRKKKQVKYISLGIAATVVFGFLSGVVLPAIGVHLPNMIFIGIVLFALCITYAIKRYGLFTLSPASAIQEILMTMPDGVILIAMDGRIFSANAAAARIFGTEEKDLPGREARTVLPQQAFDAIMAAIHEQGSFADLEADLGSRQTTVVSIAGSLVKDPAGGPAGAVLIVRDISNRRMQERALRVANEKISLLSQLTRHDINNLVSGLAGYLLLLEDFNTTPPGDSYLRTSSEIVEKISRHLRFSSEYLNLGTYNPDWQLLPVIVSSAVNDVSRGDVSITVDVPRVDVYADPLSVKVIYNLLENSLRHGTDLTSISITARRQEDGRLLIVVEDDGGGIPDKEKEIIFRYGTGKNTGFGLAFARDILEVTGITITETGTFGKGARFEILVPAGAWRQAEKPSWESSE